MISVVVARNLILFLLISCLVVLIGWDAPSARQTSGLKPRGRIFLRPGMHGYLHVVAFWHSPFLIPRTVPADVDSRD